MFACGLGTDVEAHQNTVLKKRADIHSTHRRHGVIQGTATAGR